MKQVWQANDGTLFDTLKECEEYEDRMADWNDLRDIVLTYFSLEKLEIWNDVTTILASKNGSLLFRYIKTLGEKNGN